MAKRNQNAYYVEPNGKGGYKATKGGAQKPSVTAPTQKEAIARAIRKDPEAPIHVARVRHTEGGDPDQFRKVRG